MRLCVALLAMTLLHTSTIQAAEIFRKVGTAGAQFLKIGAGARAVGMGEAFVAVADDGSTIWWNPAGVARITQDGSRLTLNHSTWPADISHEFFGYAFTYSKLPGAYAVSSTILQMDPIAIRTEFSPEGGTDGNFDAGSFNLGISWAKNLIDRFAFGLTAKYLHLGLEDANADGFVVDFGTLYYTDFKTIRIGMAIQNLGPSISFIEQVFPMPTMFRVGVAMDAYQSDAHNVLLAFEFDHPADNAERASLGGEYSLKAFQPNVLLQIRGGYRFNRDEEGLAAGFGVEFPTGSASWMRVDYAYSDMTFLTGTHKFSAELQF